MRDLLFVQRSTLFRRLFGLCRNARTDAAGALCGDACRGCTVGYRDRCSECQLSYGPDRASGQSLEVSIRRAESGGRAAVFLALQGGRQLFPGIPVRITNDANAAALGEIAYGNAGGMRDFIMVTLGTGLGSGFVAGGRMIYGHDGMAGELGHVVVEPGGRQCGCGRRGCLETYVSATGIKRTVFELMARETVPSVLRDVPYDKFDARIITEAAQKGDSLALEVFRCTAERLGRALANAVAITSPEAVFFFGGLAQAGELLLEPTRRYLEENLLPVYRGNVKVLPSGIPAQNAAILGASALIWNE